MALLQSLKLNFRWVRFLIFKIPLISFSLLSKKIRKVTSEGEDPDSDIFMMNCLCSTGQIPCVSVCPKDGYKKLTICLLVRQLQSVST